MKILSIDTSSEACSASLNIDGEIITTFEIMPQKHANVILQMCDDLLSSTELKLKQLDAVAFGQGPGSFTGLRIAAGVTQGIAFGVDIPVIKISTLAALAQQVEPSEKNSVIVAAIDARMQEVYWASYVKSEDGLVEPIAQECVEKPRDIRFQPTLFSNKAIIAIGSGFREYHEDFETCLAEFTIENKLQNQLPSAKEIGLLAAKKMLLNDVVSAEEAIPVYIRNNVAKKSTKKN